MVRLEIESANGAIMAVKSFTFQYGQIRNYSLK